MSTLNQQLPCLGCDSLMCSACFHRAADEAGYVKASSEPVEWQVRFASSNGSWMSWHPISRDAFDRYHADPPAGVQLRQLYENPTSAQAVADREKLLNMLMEANGLLRSCFQVAERMAVQFGAENGANWNALHSKLDNLLKVQQFALREEFERRAAAMAGGGE